MNNELFNMARENNTKKIFFLIIVFICIFNFKFSIINGIGNGIRIDDLLIFLSLLVILTSYEKIISFRFPKEIIMFFIFILWSGFSSFYNFMVERISLFEGIIYTFRHFEYLIFWGIGLYLGTKNYSFKKMFSWYLIYLTIIIALQSLNIIGAISNFSLTRAIGNTGGPWELAAVSSFLFLFSFYSLKNIPLSIVSFIILILSGSRVTLVATIFVVVLSSIMKLKKITFKKLLTVYIALLFITPLVFLVILGYIDIKTIERINLFFSTINLNYILNLYHSVPTPISQQEYFLFGYENLLKEVSDNLGDVSAEIRFTRWILLFHAVHIDIITMLFGLGPSFAGLAVDGYYIRVLSETGYIGLVIFLIFLSLLLKSVRKNILLFNYCIVLIITALFIDIFVTYKAMLLLWLIHGWNYGIDKMKISNNKY